MTVLWVLSHCFALTRTFKFHVATLYAPSVCIYRFYTDIQPNHIPLKIFKDNSWFTPCPILSLPIPPSSQLLYLFSLHASSGVPTSCLWLTLIVSIPLSFCHAAFHANTGLSLEIGWSFPHETLCVTSCHLFFNVTSLLSKQYNSGLCYGDRKLRSICVYK